MSDGNELLRGRAESGATAAPRVMRWTGTTWSVISVPISSDVRWTTLNGISCAAANRCVAIGLAQRGTSSSDVNPLVASWNGTKWTARLLPMKANNWSFYDISCATPTACVAIGSVIFDFRRHPLALRWNGSTWSMLGVPRTDGTSLWQVSCPAAATCVAVGGSRSGRYALRWNGSGWFTMAVPKPAGVPSAYLRNVDCPTPKLCRAIGASYSPDGMSQAIVWSWNGTKWSVAHVAPRVPSQLAAISCATVANCVAAGYSHGTHTTRTFTERWNGTVWSETPSPNTAAARSFLSDVSCASATSCHAVGFGALSDGSSNQLFALHWNGTNWSRTL